MNLEDLHKAESIAKEQLKDFQDFTATSVVDSEGNALIGRLRYLQTNIVMELEKYIEVEEHRLTKIAIVEELEGACRSINEALFLIKKSEGENNNFFELGGFRSGITRVMNKYNYQYLSEDNKEST